MFISGLTIAGGARYDYIQAAEADEMEALFAKYLTDLIAENVARAEPYNVVDMDIAGGGDGHTFVVRLLVSTDVAPTAWVSTSLAAVIGRFWLGADAEALAAYQEAAIAALVSAGTPISNVAVGLAGAAKGTRFMAFIAGQTSPQA